MAHDFSDSVRGTIQAGAESVAIRQFDPERYQSFLTDN
jgi:hypothetical protein